MTLEALKLYTMDLGARQRRQSFLLDGSLSLVLAERARLLIEYNNMLSIESRVFQFL